MQSLQMRWPVPAAIGLSMVTMASAPMELPFCLTTFISEIFSSSGQPASVTPKTLFLNAPVFLLQAGGATILALVVALDAVVRLIERAGQIHAGVGQLESFAMPPAMLRAARSLATPFICDGLHRDQMHADPACAAP